MTTALAIIPRVADVGAPRFLPQLRVVSPPPFKGRVYIAGPMRGCDEFNHPAFDAAAARWRADGWDVVSPAEEDRRVGLPPTVRGRVPSGWLRKVVAHNVAMLLTCNAVALLPSWEDSRGALAELAVAAAIDPPLAVYNAVTMLPMGDAVTVWNFRYG